MLLLANVLFLTEVWDYSVTRAGFAFFPGPLTAAVVAGLAGRLGDRFGSARVGALGGILFALASVWFLTVLDDHPRYLTAYPPGTLLGGIGVSLILPAFTTLAVPTLPPERLSTGIGVQTMFRQIGAALGLAAFVAIVGSSKLTATSDYDGPWLFMAIAAAGAGLVLTPLFHSESRLDETAPPHLPATFAQWTVDKHHQGRGSSCKAAHLGEATRIGTTTFQAAVGTSASPRSSASPSGVRA